MDEIAKDSGDIDKDDGEEVDEDSLVGKGNGRYLCGHCCKGVRKQY